MAAPPVPPPMPPPVAPPVPPPAEELDQIAEMVAKVREFMEVSGFSLGHYKLMR